MFIIEFIVSGGVALDCILKSVSNIFPPSCSQYNAVNYNLYKDRVKCKVASHSHSHKWHFFPPPYMTSAHTPWPAHAALFPMCLLCLASNFQKVGLHQ